MRLAIVHMPTVPALRIIPRWWCSPSGGGSLGGVLSGMRKFYGKLILCKDEAPIWRFTECQNLVTLRVQTTDVGVMFDERSTKTTGSLERGTIHDKQPQDFRCNHCRIFGHRHY